MNAIAAIPQRPLIRPTYTLAETYAAWITINAELVMDYWRTLRAADGQDPDRFAYAELVDFAKSQYDTTRSPTSSDPQSPRNRISSAPAGESDGATAGLGAAKASFLSHDELVVSQYRQAIYAHERLIDKLYDLARAERWDELHDLVRAEYLSIHGPRD
jgi:hypothetical protein